jgi:hypothetical protein
MSKQELEQAKNRVLAAIAAQRAKVEIINSDPRKGNGISVTYKKRNYFFPLASSNSNFGRSQF